MLSFLQTYGLSLSLTAASCFLAVRPWVNKILCERRNVEELTEAARDRIVSLRQKSLIYWCFEPLLPTIGRHAWTGRLINLEKLERSLRSATPELTLPSEEYAGLLVVRGAVVAIGCCILGACCLSPTITLVLTVIAGLGTSLAGARTTHNLATKRRSLVRKRLPYVIDLLAMQIHAGSSFRQALAMVAKELREHPLGQELRRVLSECDRGTPLTDALEGMNQRLLCDEINEFVKAIQNGHRRGTEMSQTLQNLTNQFLCSRTERLESLAGKLQVNIAFPGFLVMGACLLIIIGPIALQAIFSNELLRP